MKKLILACVVVASGIPAAEAQEADPTSALEQVERCAAGKCWSAASSDPGSPVSAEQSGGQAADGDLQKPPRASRLGVSNRESADVPTPERTPETSDRESRRFFSPETAALFAGVLAYAAFMFVSR